MKADRICVKGITRSGPLSALLSSRRSLIANMRLKMSAVGCTWTIPCLIVHGPNPATSCRSRTMRVRSWCHATFQLDSCVLLKNVPLTAKQCFPRTASARFRTAAEVATSRTIGSAKRFRFAYEPSPKCAARLWMTSSLRQEATIAKPSCSTFWLRSGRFCTTEDTFALRCNWNGFAKEAGGG